MPRIPIPGDLVAAAEAAAQANPALAGYLNALPIPRHLTKRHGGGASSTRRSRSKGSTHRSSSTTSRHSAEDFAAAAAAGGQQQGSQRFGGFEGSQRPASSAASANSSSAAQEAAKGQYLIYLKETLQGMNQSLRQVQLVVQKGVGTVQRSRSFRGDNTLPSNFLDESVLQRGIEDLKRSHSELLSVAGMM